MLLSKRSRTPSSVKEQRESSPEIMEGSVMFWSSDKQSGQLQQLMVPSLEQCRFCYMKLSPNEDIFMYDDLGFCSEECRERQRRSDGFARLRELVKGKKGRKCSSGVSESSLPFQLK